MVNLAAKAAGVLSFGLLRSVADYRDLAAITRAAQKRALVARARALLAKGSG
jgi:hypothetical protein